MGKYDRGFALDDNLSAKSNAKVSKDENSLIYLEDPWARERSEFSGDFGLCGQDWAIKVRGVVGIDELADVLRSKTPKIRHTHRDRGMYKEDGFVAKTIMDIREVNKDGNTKISPGKYWNNLYGGYTQIDTREVGIHVYGDRSLSEIVDEIMNIENMTIEAQPFGLCPAKHREVGMNEAKEIASAFIETLGVLDEKIERAKDRELSKGIGR